MMKDITLFTVVIVFLLFTWSNNTSFRQMLSENQTYFPGCFQRVLKLY